ncbi:hypothetical protein AMTRI_Chr10g232860 [Amborella trichopoda]
MGFGIFMPFGNGWFRLRRTTSLKKEVVIKVSMKCQKCHSEAMVNVAKQLGVEVIKLDGDKNQLTVIGEEIDSARLTCSLRKKFGYAQLVSVKPATEKKKEEPVPKKMECQWQPLLCHYHYIEPSPCQYYNEGSVCSIM